MPPRQDWIPKEKEGGKNELPTTTTLQHQGDVSLDTQDELIRLMTSDNTGNFKVLSTRMDRVSLNNQFGHFPTHVNKS